MSSWNWAGVAVIISGAFFLNEYIRACRLADKDPHRIKPNVLALAFTQLLMVTGLILLLV